LGRKVRKVCKERLALKAPVVKLVLKELKVLWAHKELLVLRVKLALRDLKASRVRLDQLEHRESKVLREKLVRLGQWVHKVSKAQPEFKVLKVTWD
jgi:hypothetical protein